MKFSAQKFKDFRVESGLSQERLMVKLDGEGIALSRPTICNWEYGTQNPRSDELAAVARIFNKKIEDFFE